MQRVHASSAMSAAAGMGSAAQPNLLAWLTGVQPALAQAWTLTHSSTDQLPDLPSLKMLVPS